MESDPAGSAERAVPAGHLSGTGVSEYRAQTRLCREATHQETQYPGTRQAQSASQNPQPFPTSHKDIFANRPMTLTEIEICHQFEESNRAG